MIEHGLYKHFKGDLYFVQGVARHSETEEPMVVYEKVKTGEQWVRPLAMFTEEVERDGYKGPRFRHLLKRELKELFKPTTTDGRIYEHVGESGRLIFHFANSEAALHFKEWLSGSGEQGYWEWMKQVEFDEEDGDITVLNFDYHTGTNIIETKVGRLDEK